MNGVINIFKPPGLTSHDVVSHIRRKLSMKRVGHTGTLDPMATGVLPICIGQATKIVEFLMADQKKYRFEITFGYETDTLDAWGKITKDSPHKSVERHELEVVLSAMTGPQFQVPPQYSALKVDGKRAYELARQDEYVELKARPIDLYHFDLIHFNHTSALIDITCSKGTYVRSIVRDIGYALNTLGTMTFLLRIQTGKFDYLDAVPLHQFIHAEDPTDFIIPIENALGIHNIYIDAQGQLESQLRNGVPLWLEAYDPSGDQTMKLVFLNHALLGLAEYKDGHLKITKRF
jgi:tRNA pseudouridine55 synthase